MYRITWQDKDSGERKTLKVSSIRTVREVTATLARQPWKYSEVSFTSIMRRRVREIVITLES